MPWPFLTCKRDGTLIFANEHFSRMLQINTALNEGSLVQELFSVDEGTVDLGGLLQSVSVDEAWHGKWEFGGGEGRLTFEVMLRVDQGESGEQIWAVVLENPVINNQMILSTRSELRLLQLLMDHTLDYVFFMDPSGRLIITNQAFQEALNVPFPGSEIGQSIFEFVDESTAASFSLSLR